MEEEKAHELNLLKSANWAMVGGQAGFRQGQSARAALRIRPAVSGARKFFEFCCQKRQGWIDILIKAC